MARPRSIGFPHQPSAAGDRLARLAAPGTTCSTPTYLRPRTREIRDGWREYYWEPLKLALAE